MKLVLVVLALFCTSVLSQPDPVCVTTGITDDATLVPCKEGFEAVSYRSLDSYVLMLFMQTLQIIASGTINRLVAVDANLRHYGISC